MWDEGSNGVGSLKPLKASRYISQFVMIAPFLSVIRTPFCTGRAFLISTDDVVGILLILPDELNWDRFRKRNFADDLNRLARSRFLKCLSKLLRALQTCCFLQCLAGRQCIYVWCWTRYTVYSSQQWSRWCSHVHNELMKSQWNCCVIWVLMNPGGRLNKKRSYQVWQFPC